MNKNRHRVVFNAARGLRVVVAECARALGKASTATSAALITASLLPAHAQIVADPSAPGNQRPTVLTAPNGVPLVNIQTPSAAGVSRNTYRQFDVNSAGAILNNSRTNTQTQLGGWVQGNPWLASGGARVILNEVNSTSPSYLNGFVEVAGQRAEVIIANPAGIQVNGGGFINAAGVTLTTGRPVMNAGSLESFRVQGGQVRIEGLGLDTRTADHTTILTRAMEVNAAIWANRLTVVGGAGETRASGTDPAGAPITQPIAADPNAPQPRFMLDVAAIGGMYAGKIFLVGSEAGLGVNNGGVISAQQDLVLLPNGQLINRGSAYGQHIRIDAPSVHNRDGGVIAARDSLTLNAGQIHNTEGAELLSLGQMTLNASERIENRSARIEAQGALSITTPVLVNANDHFKTELVAQPGQRYLRLRHGGVDYKAEDLGLNFQRLDQYDDQAGYAVLLPSAEYPFSQYPALADLWAVSVDGRYQVQLSRTSQLLCPGSDCNPTEVDTYAAGHPIWQRLGVTPFGAAPVYTGPACEYDSVACSPSQWADHAAWKEQVNQYNAHKAAQQNALDQKINAYNDSVSARTLNDWVVIDAASTEYNPRVLSSAPGQIVSGGDMTLNTSTQLLNHNSEILAGGTLRTNGATLENRGSDVIARTEMSGQSVLSWLREQGLLKNDDRLYEFSPYQAVQERGEKVNVARSAGGQAIPPVVTSALFKSAPNAQSAYLIETDPLFADHRQWLGSDYLLNALGHDPDRVQKRLGDGFYEQRLIREQVGQLTGQRFLGDYRDDEAQFLALMNAGLTFAQAYELRPGIALSADQMAALTSDIVWLVAEDVTLPDGRTEKALVPRVYLAPRAGDLAPSGALIAGSEVRIHMSGDVLNSGTIAGRQLVQIDAARDIHHSGQITTQGTAALSAGRDIHVAGGEIGAKDAIVLDAGRDLNIASTTRSTTTKIAGNTFERTGIHRQARLTISGEAGVLLAQAGRDITLTAADIRNDSEGGVTAITAGRDLNLTTVRTSAEDDLHWNPENRQRTARAQDVGTRIETTGDLQLQAGRDLNARAANVQAQGDLSAQAGRDVSIQAGTQTLDFADAHHKKTSDFLASGSITTRSTVNTADAMSSQFGGRTVDIQAGQDLSVRGSNVISDQGTTLSAGRDVSITAAQTTSSSTNFREEKNSGLLDSGGGLMLGSQQQSADQQREGTGVVASTIGAITGDVTIVAGRHYRQVGSDVIAAGASTGAPSNETVTSQTPGRENTGGNITVIAQDIQIVEARTTERSRLEEKTRQSGVSVGAGGTMVEAAQSIGNTIEATEKTEDRRMQALGASAAGLQAYNAAASTTANPESAVGITFTLGSSSSQNTLEREADESRGSSLRAGGDVHLIASGAGKDSDILVRGSHIKAGDTAVLSAAGDIDLSAATNTAQERSRSESNSASVSATYNGSWSFSATAQSGRGTGDGEEVIHSNTRVEAGRLVQLESGGDTTLKGAVVAANTVKAEVGGKLTIQSLQDSSTWRESNSQSGGTLGYGNGSITGASASGGKTDIRSDYASVGEQSGIRAGDGGFQVNVQGRTELIGGAITSTQAAVDQERNQFNSDGGLTLSDIHNSASFEATSVGVSVGVGSQLGNSGAGVGSASGSTSSTTVAAISGIAGNKAARTGDAETGLVPIFDKEKVRDEVESQVSITKAFGQQAGKAIGRYGNEQLDKAKKLKEAAASETDPVVRETLIAEANALEDTWKEGGTGRVALHMLAGLASGGAAGAAGAGVTQTALPALGDHIAALDLPVEVKQAMVQTIAVALGAAVGGGAGAATGLAATSQNYLSATDLRNKHQKLNDCRSSGDAACEIKVLREYELKNAKNTGAIDYRSVLSESALQAERALLEQVLKDPALSDAAKAEARRSIKELDTAINVIQRSPVLRDAAELGLIVLDVVAMGQLAAAKMLTTAAVRELVLARTGKEIGELEAARIANNLGKDGAAAFLLVTTSDGRIIFPTAGKTTTLLGSWRYDTNRVINYELSYPKANTYLDAKPDGFNLLNTPNEVYETLGPKAFWEEVNKPFLDAAILRNDEIVLLTPPTPEILGGSGAFRDEFNYLLSRGYRYDPKLGKMVKDGNG